MQRDVRVQDKGSFARISIFVKIYFWYHIYARNKSGAYCRRGMFVATCCWNCRIALGLTYKRVDTFLQNGSGYCLTTPKDAPLPQSVAHHSDDIYVSQRNSSSFIWQWYCIFAPPRPRATRPTYAGDYVGLLVAMLSRNDRPSAVSYTHLTLPTKA